MPSDPVHSTDAFHSTTADHTSSSSACSGSVPRTRENSLLSSSYSIELSVALDAVHRASVLTKNVMRGMDFYQKSDTSPVTVADFAAQALIIAALHHYFPNDDIIAEESADLLRSDALALDRVWKLVASADSIANRRSAAELPAGLPSVSSATEMMNLIDLGGKTSVSSSGRVWYLDPIDGTKSFLSSQQYAVCLCFILDGHQTVGVLGCPNLPWGYVRDGRLREVASLENVTDPNGYGCVAYAVYGQGSFVASLDRTDIGHAICIQLVEDRPTELSRARFLDSVQSSSRDHALHQKVYERIRVETPLMDIWSTQVKYVALALDIGDAWFRIPPTADNRCWIWDHAGGMLVFEEAGGIVRSIHGKSLRSGPSRRFEEAWGYIVAKPGLFPALVDATDQVLEEFRPR